MKAILTLTILFNSFLSYSTTYRVYLKVIDANTNQEINNANIRLGRYIVTKKTNTDGYYEFTLPQPIFIKDELSIEHYSYRVDKKPLYENDVKIEGNKLYFKVYAQTGLGFISHSHDIAKSKTKVRYKKEYENPFEFIKPERDLTYQRIPYNAYEIFFKKNEVIDSLNEELEYRISLHNKQLNNLEKKNDSLQIRIKELQKEIDELKNPKRKKKNEFGLDKPGPAPEVTIVEPEERPKKTRSVEGIIQRKENSLPFPKSGKIQFNMALTKIRDENPVKYSGEIYILIQYDETGKITNIEPLQMHKSHKKYAQKVMDLYKNTVWHPANYKSEKVAYNLVHKIEFYNQD